LPQYLKEILKTVYQFDFCAMSFTALSGMVSPSLMAFNPAYREFLERSLGIASISSPDLRQSIAIIREMVHPDGKPTSFGMIARMLGMAKATVAEHYTRSLAGPRYGLWPTG
jgi:hypothetical protein